MWRLSAEGHAAAVRLAGWPGWTGVTLVASSPEPKAVDTATPIAGAVGVTLRIEDDLREVRRPERPLADRADYVRLASRYLRGEPVHGWEPALKVRRRVTSCIDRLVETRGDVAVVSHGLALSLFLGVGPEEWERIPLSAVAVVEPRSRRVLEPWTCPV